MSFLSAFCIGGFILLHLLLTGDGVDGGVNVIGQESSSGNNVQELISADDTICGSSKTAVHIFDERSEEKMKQEIEV